MNLIEKIKHDKKIRKIKEGIIAFFAVLIFAAAFLGFYMKEETKVVKVYSVTSQQYVGGSDDGFTTSYNYIVSTSDGAYEIKASGIFHSNSFGSLKDGETYKIHSRGYRIAIIGILPYIIDAEQVTE